jgi:hypothetical protein
MQLPRPLLHATARPRAPLVLTGKADAAGRAVLRSPPVEAGTRWLIDYIVVSSSGGACACNVYDSDELISRLIDGTSSLGNGGVAAYAPSRPLASGSTLLLVWTGAGANTNVAARVEYHDEPEV